MNISYNETDPESTGLDRFHEAITTILISLGIPAAILNLFVSTVALKLFSSTRDPVHLFILSMALGDFLLTGIASPLETFGKFSGFLDRDWLPCILVHFSNWLGLAVSAISLSILNLDKLLYFQWPLHYESLMSTKKAVASIIGLWVLCVSFVTVVMQLAVRPTGPSSHCSAYVFPAWSYDLHTILFCTIPIITSAVLSLYLYYLTRRLRQYAPPGGNESRQSAGRLANIRSLVFIFVTTAWTVISLLPFRLFNLARLHLIYLSRKNEFAVGFGWFLYTLLMLNPIVNPVITATIYAPYRQTWKHMLNIFNGCKKIQRSENSRNSAISRSTLLKSYTENGRRRGSIDISRGSAAQCVDYV